MLTRARSIIPNRLDPVCLPGELWGVIAYFNPAAYRNKREHLTRCADRARSQGLRLIIVEAAVGSAAFEVPDECGDVVIHLDNAAVLWQKERLLNIGIDSAPPRCDKIVWLDGDVLFWDDDWVSETAALLNRHILVQPFSRVHWLEKGFIPTASTFEDVNNLMCKVVKSDSGAVASESVVPSLEWTKGQAGFAWAIRRECLTGIGLYDRFIVGGADTAIASASYGLSVSHVFPELCSTSHLRDVTAWMECFHQRVQGSVGFREGSLFHLWHGSTPDRHYLQRHALLKDAHFDPLTDIGIDVGGTWRWTSDKHNLHKELLGYFNSRREDA